MNISLWKQSNVHFALLNNHPFTNIAENLQSTDNASVELRVTQSPDVSIHQSAERSLKLMQQRLVGAKVWVEFDTSPKAGKDWIDIVDKATGEIIYKIPSENLRKLVENSQGVSGIYVNEKR